MMQAVQVLNNKGLAYDEININCGCPSKSAAAGTFGVVLMKQPEVKNYIKLIKFS
jgi:tRNA-dihydrouridine synthase